MRAPCSAPARYITVTNSYFSTRWSVFRFGGGHAGNIAVSNCVLREVYGCPIKFQGDPGSTFENISFSNLVLNDVTGPISISVGEGCRRPNDKNCPGGRPEYLLQQHSRHSDYQPSSISFLNAPWESADRPGEGPLLHRSQLSQ